MLPVLGPLMLSGFKVWSLRCWQVNPLRSRSLCCWDAPLQHDDASTVLSYTSGFTEWWSVPGRQFVSHHINKSLCSLSFKCSLTNSKQAVMSILPTVASVSVLCWSKGLICRDQLSSLVQQVISSLQRTSQSCVFLKCSMVCSVFSFL